MTITIHAQGAERKRLVQTISDWLGVPAKYCGAPTFNYEVDYFTIDRNGSLSFDDSADSADSEVIERLLQHIYDEGFDIDQSNADDEDEPCAVCISMPRSLFTDSNLENLKALIAAKGNLIKKALGVADLPLEITDTKVSFPWFPATPTPDEMNAYDTFICKLCEMARNQKRVNATEKPTNNEKYAFRCFLLRLGFIGAEYKTARKILLRNLAGSSAFRSGQRLEVSMRVISKEALQALRERFPKGTRVELLKMDDPQAPPIGTKGTVRGVDDIGSIMVAWDNGCGLSVAWGEDECRVLPSECDADEK